MADFALLSESDWVINPNQITSREKIRLVYPAYRLTFNFPLTVWGGSETTADEKTAIKQFGDFLAQDAAQTRMTDYGLRPAKIQLTTANAPLFATASAVGIVLDTPPGTFIAVPPRDSALTILSWARTVRSS